MSECVATRAPRLEIDVRFLADDGMLVFHDAALDRETTGTGRVRELTSDQAATFRYRESEAVPLCFLDEVVDAMRGSETLLQVDLKPMRALSAARVDALAQALEPVRDHVLIGSQAHWNLRPLAERGFDIAFDPTLQWQYAPGRAGERQIPSRRGVHGLWDDSPAAHIRSISFEEYCDIRITDLTSLLPPVREWMVDIETIRYCTSHGLLLGDELERRGIALAAWTMRDEGRVASSDLLRELFAAGVTTVITDHAATLAGYAAKLD